MDAGVSAAESSVAELQATVQRLQAELEAERARRIELEGSVELLKAQQREARGARPRAQDAIVLAALRGHR